jgi:multiple sugar transport system permease protein
MISTREKRDRIFAINLLVPAFLVFSIVIFVPIIKGIIMSFMDHTIYNMAHPVFNGLDNYIKLFKSGIILTYFKNTFFYVFFEVGIQFLLAFMLALALSFNLKGREVYRGLFLIAWTIPSVAVAMLWTLMFQSQYGIINYLLSSVGWISDSNLLWTQSPERAMITVIVAVMWRQLPYMVTMLVAGLLSVSRELIEAATIDGCNRLRVLQHVIFPSISTVLVTTITISIINNFQMFTIIYNMTGGGPMDKTMTLSVGAYHAAFVQHDLGSGSAIGVLWLIVLSVFSVINIRASEKKNSVYI